MDIGSLTGSIELDDRMSDVLDHIDTKLKAIERVAETSMSMTASKMTLAVTAGNLLANALSDVAAHAISFAKNLFDGSIMAGARLETLGQVSVFLGERAGYTAKQINDLSDKIEGTGITATDSRQAIVQLLEKHIDLGKAAQLSAVAQNMAVVSGRGSSETYGMMVNALGVLNSRMIRSIGFSFTMEEATNAWRKETGKLTGDLTLEEKRLAAVNAMIKEGEEFAGLYALAMGTASKQVGSADRVWAQVGETLGKIVLPITTSLITAWYDLGTTVKKKMLEIQTAVGPTFVLIGGYLKTLIGHLTDFAGTALPLVVSGIKTVATYLVDFNRRFEITDNLVTAAKAAWNALQTAFEYVKKAVSAVITAWESMPDWLKNITKATFEASLAVSAYALAIGVVAAPLSILMGKLDMAINIVGNFAGAVYSLINMPWTKGIALVSAAYTWLNTQLLISNGLMVAGQGKVLIGAAQYVTAATGITASTHTMTGAMSGLAAAIAWVLAPLAVLYGSYQLVSWLEKNVKGVRELSDGWQLLGLMLQGYGPTEAAVMIQTQHTTEALLKETAATRDLAQASAEAAEADKKRLLDRMTGGKVVLTTKGEVDITASTGASGELAKLQEVYDDVLKKGDMATDVLQRFVVEIRNLQSQGGKNPFLEQLADTTQLQAFEEVYTKLVGKGAAAANDAKRFADQLRALAEKAGEAAPPLLELAARFDALDASAKNLAAQTIWEDKNLVIVQGMVDGIKAASYEATNSATALGQMAAAGTLNKEAIESFLPAIEKQISLGKQLTVEQELAFKWLNEVNKAELDAAVGKLKLEGVTLKVMNSLRALGMTEAEIAYKFNTTTAAMSRQSKESGLLETATKRLRDLKENLSATEGQRAITAINDRFEQETAGLNKLSEEYIAFDQARVEAIRQTGLNVGAVQASNTKQLLENYQKEQNTLDEMVRQGVNSNSTAFITQKNAVEEAKVAAQGWGKAVTDGANAGTSAIDKQTAAMKELKAASAVPSGPVDAAGNAVSSLSSDRFSQGQFESAAEKAGSVTLASVLKNMVEKGALDRKVYGGGSKTGPGKWVAEAGMPTTLEDLAKQTRVVYDLLTYQAKTGYELSVTQQDVIDRWSLLGGDLSTLQQYISSRVKPPESSVLTSDGTSTPPVMPNVAGGSGGAQVTIGPGAIVQNYPIMRDRESMGQLGNLVGAAVVQHLSARGALVFGAR